MERFAGLRGPCSRTVATPRVAVAEILHAPGSRLSSHAHRRGSLCYALESPFEARFGRRTLAVERGELLVEPPGEPHANRFGSAGARNLAIELAPSLWAEVAGRTPRLGRPAALPGLAPASPQVAAILAELAAPDRGTPLALEAALFELVSSALRTPPRQRSLPPWLARVRAELEERFLDPPTLESLAAAHRVHPGSLARAFRRHLGLPVGAFVRRRRLEWCAARLREGRWSIAAIAQHAGFTDQSHLNRWFKRWAGTTAGAYRRRAGPPPPAHG